MSELIHLKHELMQAKISLNASLSKGKEDNKNWSASAQQWSIERKQFIKGIKAVRDLINESDGVAGLHLNGDLALWHVLEEGSQFGDWLKDFNCAEALIE